VYEIKCAILTQLHNFHMKYYEKPSMHYAVLNGYRHLTHVKMQSKISTGVFGSGMGMSRLYKTLINRCLRSD
jgi:hypothetical protein